MDGDGATSLYVMLDVRQQAGRPNEAKPKISQVSRGQGQGQIPASSFGALSPLLLQKMPFKSSRALS